MAVIQSYNREDAFRGQFDELNRANQRSNQHAQNLSSLFFPAIELFGVIATVAVLALGARLYEDGTLTIGTLIAFIGLLALVFQPLQELSELYGQVQSAAAAMEKITTVLDVETDIASPADARRIERVEGHVALESVTFAYGARPRAARHRPRHPGRQLRRARRRVGRRQVDAGAAGRALLRPARGRGARRRQRPARDRPRALPPPARRRAAGPVPVRRHDRRQPPLRGAGRDATSSSRRPRARSASTASPRASRRASTTRCARAAPGSRRASAS